MSRFTMRRLVAIGSPEKPWELPDSISTYLAAFTYPWLTTSGLVDEPACHFTLTAEQREGLKEVLEAALQHLVEQLYPGRPSERQFTKHPGRFERIEVNGKSYLVNYRTSVPGWLMYVLFTQQQAVDRNPEVAIELTQLPPDL
jgi:hypothetical protein